MFDLIIIGAGIAGMTASIYTSRYGIKHLIFGENPGGQGNEAHQVENYSGIKSIKGPELMKQVLGQVENYGVEVRRERVVELKKDLKDHFRVKTAKGEYKSKALILAMGATNRQMNIPGEAKFLGKGVSYCTVCDAPFFKNKVVTMVGGGNAALSGALHLASFAKKVYLIHRRDKFRAEKIWVDKVRKKDNIELILSSMIKEVYGKEKVEGIIIKTLKHENIKTRKEQKVDGLFIEVGKIPSSLLASSLGVKLDKRNFVLVGPNMMTNIKGVFAAGDLSLQRNQIVLCQFIAAAADGARAAASVYHYLTKKPVISSWGTHR